MKNPMKRNLGIIGIILFVLIGCNLTTVAQENAGSETLVRVYKTVDSTQLKAHIILPCNQKENARLPVFVFFHGGGWSQGRPENGLRMCQYWAERGMAAISFEYRLANSKDVTPVECIQDAKSAIRWVRSQAVGLGIDPNRIVATGGSAGGHLAVSTAILEGFEETGEDTTLSTSPNAVAGWSAAVNVVEDDWFKQLLGEHADALDCSPAHHIRPDLPPMALLHGTRDATVPYWTIEQFAREMKKAGNRCDLHPYENGDHIFHVQNRAHVLGVIEEFLKSLNYLSSVSE